jgi:hypothetical protein
VAAVIAEHEGGDENTAVDTERDAESVGSASDIPGVTADIPSRNPRWLRVVIATTAIVTLAAVAVMIDGAIRHHADQAADRRETSAVDAARKWVTLFVTATDDNVVARADEILAGTTDPLQANAMDRIEPYLEMLDDDGSGHRLQVTSAAIERDGARTGRPPLPKDATVVLVTTTARSRQLGHGYALWLYVIDRAGEAKIVDFGGAG